MAFDDFDTQIQCDEIKDWYDYKMYFGALMTEEVEVPEWLTISIPRETYTSDDYSFDLAFAAEALPAGVEGRTATVTFMQEGARLTVTVNQGETSGISVTKTDVKSGNAQMYNLAGQRVNDGFKGLVIKNGRKFMNK